MSELINPQVAVQAIRDMASARGLHVSASQAETVLGQIEARSSAEQIEKAWTVLNPQSTAMRVFRMRGQPRWN